MSRYLLDTDTLISFSKRAEPAFSFVRQAIADGDELGITPVNAAEFYAGLAPAQYPIWDAFFAPLEYWPITLAAAKQAGRWRYDFARRGQPLPTTDTLVAAVAAQQQAVIVTNNVGDYPMQEVQVLAPAR